MVFFFWYSGFYLNLFVLFVSPFNMVLERDNEHTLETLENDTTNKNQIEETSISFSVAVIDARMSGPMDEWFICLHKTFKNKFPSFPIVVYTAEQASRTVVGTPRATARVAGVNFPPQTTPTIQSVQSFSSSITYIAPYAPIYIMPPNFDRPPSLLPSNLYALPPTDPCYHPNVKNPQIYSTFEVGESLAHSNHNV